MKYLRAYLDAGGASAQSIVDAEMISAQPFADAPPANVSAQMAAKQARFFDFPAGWAAGWHPAPCRRLIVTHAGTCEIETGDGKKHVLRAGDIALLEDTSGRGHHTRVLDEGRWQGVAIDLP
jgi:hypothetical protein